MKIAIIGAGNVGSTLGKAWAKRGHQIIFGARRPGDDKHDLLRSLDNIEVATAEDAARRSDILALATPWPATQSALVDCGNLDGKIVIDCTNPIKDDFSGLAIGHSTSGAETVAEWASGAHVIKAMNQIGYASMDSPDFIGGKPVMFVCGNDSESKNKVLGLVDQLGFEAIDSGALDVARLLEPFAMLWIHSALKQGMGVDFGFGILRKNS